jgi:hypothetical protein
MTSTSVVIVSKTPELSGTNAWQHLKDPPDIACFSRVQTSLEFERSFLKHAFFKNQIKASQLK